MGAPYIYDISSLRVKQQLTRVRGVLYGEEKVSKIKKIKKSGGCLLYGTWLTIWSIDFNLYLAVRTEKRQELSVTTGCESRY